MTYIPNIIKKLTIEDIDKMKIFSSISRMRENIGVDISKIVPETEEVPTLFYVKREKDGVIEDEVNACVVDICRFLLKRFVQPVTPDFQPSIIRWDRKYGKTAEGIWYEPLIQDHTIIFRGEIAKYPAVPEDNIKAGNQVGVDIIIDARMIDKYPMVKIWLDNNMYSKEILCKIGEYYILHHRQVFTRVGSYKNIVFDWDCYHQEIFNIILTEDSTLES